MPNHPNLETLIEQSNQILLTGHVAYDDDSIASTLALFYLLKRRYPHKHLSIIYTGQPTTRYEYFENFHEIQFVNDLADHINNVDLIIFLDGNRFHRFTKQIDKLQNFVGKTICLDHHDCCSDEFTFSLVNPKIPSTTQIIYETFCKNKKIDRRLAEIFLLGILGDTGYLSYVKPTQTETFNIVGQLLKKNKIEIQEFKSHFETFSPRIFNLISEFVKNTSFQKVEGWPEFQISYVDRSFAEKYQYSDAELGEGSNIYKSLFLRAVNGYTWGYVGYPLKDGSCRVSFRSIPGSVDVKNLTERMNIGTGHIRAAGALVKGDKILDTNESIGQITRWIKENKPVIC